MKDTMHRLTVILSWLTTFALPTVHLSVDQTKVDLVQWDDYNGKVICYTPIQLFDLQSQATIVNDGFLQRLWPVKLDMPSFPSDETYRRTRNIVLIYQRNLKSISTLMTFQHLTAKERRKKIEIGR